MSQTLDIFIDELLADEELRFNFFRNPRRMRWLAEQWELPLTDSEIQALIAMDPSLWDRIAEQLCSRLQQAA